VKIPLGIILFLVSAMLIILLLKCSLQTIKQFGYEGKSYKLNNNELKKNSAKYSVKIWIN